MINTPFIIVPSTKTNHQEYAKHKTQNRISQQFSLNNFFFNKTNKSIFFLNFNLRDGRQMVNIENLYLILMKNMYLK